MQTSGPKSPCKICGRTKDGDCRSTPDLILCHTGTDLRPGETITIDGQLWAFIRGNGGFSGMAAVFRPHSDRAPLDQRSTAKHDAQTKARHAVAAYSIERFYEAFQAAWDLPDFHTLTPDQLCQGAATLARAQEVGTALAKNLQCLWREAPELKELHRERVNGYLKSLAYQVEDFRHFKQHYLGEVG